MPMISDFNCYLLENCTGLRNGDTIKLSSMVTIGIGIDFTIYWTLNLPSLNAYINHTWIRLRIAIHNPQKLACCIVPYRQLKPGYCRAQKSLMWRSDTRSYEWFLKVVCPECVLWELSAELKDPARLGIKLVPNWAYTMGEQMPGEDQLYSYKSFIPSIKGCAASGMNIFFHLLVQHNIIGISPYEYIVTLLVLQSGPLYILPRSGTKTFKKTPKDTNSHANTKPTQCKWL